MALDMPAARDAYDELDRRDAEAGRGLLRPQSRRTAEAEADRVDRGQQLADQAVASLSARAADVAARQGLDHPLVKVFLDVAGTVARERARIAAGLPFDAPEVAALRDEVRVVERVIVERPTLPPAPEPAPEPEDMPLPPRRLEAVRAAADGLTAAEAAERLGVSVNTVKTHWKRAAQDLGVSGRALVGAAARLGLLG